MSAKNVLVTRKHIVFNSDFFVRSSYQTNADVTIGGNCPLTGRPLSQVRIPATVRESGRDSTLCAETRCARTMKIRSLNPAVSRAGGRRTGVSEREIRFSPSHHVASGMRLLLLPTPSTSCPFVTGPRAAVVVHLSYRKPLECDGV